LAKEGMLKPLKRHLEAEEIFIIPAKRKPEQKNDRKKDAKRKGVIGGREHLERKTLENLPNRKENERFGREGPPEVLARKKAFEIQEKVLLGGGPCPEG